MKYVKMDNIEIPQIALGTWSWGTGMNGGNMIYGNKLNKNDLKLVFDEAIKSGFTLWDTAAVYGNGTAETILGQFLKDYNNVAISTKFTPMGIQRKSAMQKSLSRSMLRLGINNVDIYWIHTPQNIEKWINEIVPLMKSSKIKYAGVSNHNLDEIKQANIILEKFGLRLSAVQNHYSLLYRSSEEAGILNWCNKNNILFFSYMLLEQGALTGKYNADNPFKRNTRRGKAFPVETLKKLDGLIGTMKEISEKYNGSIAQIAIAWAIAKHTIPIIGVTKVTHIKDAKASLSICLSPEEMFAIENAAKLSGVSVKASWEKSMVLHSIIS